MSTPLMEAANPPVSNDEARPALWQNRPFLAIWAGHAISTLGDGFHSLALGLWVLQSTGSASAMATVMAVKALVSILLGPLAGTFVDRADRRKVMLVTDLSRFILVGVTALLVKSPGAPLTAVVALTALTAVFGQFFSPAFAASLANIVRKDDMARASGLLQVTNTLGMVVGPLLGGSVVAIFGGWTALSADAFSFLASAALILLGGAFASPRREGEGVTFWADLKEGLSYIATVPMVRSIVVTAPLMNLFANAIAGVLVPVIAVKIWLSSSVQFGALESAFPLGFAIGAGLYTALASRVKHRGAVIATGGLIGSGLLMVVGLMPSAWTAVPIYVVCGIAIALPNVIFQVMLQSEVPLTVQGRVFGTIGSLVSLANPIAFMLAGFLSDRYNPILISVGAGMLLVLTMLGCFILSPQIRQYQ